MARKRRKRPHGTGSVTVRDGRAQLRWTENGVRRTKTVDLAEYQTFLARACAGLEAAPAPQPSHGNLDALVAPWLASRCNMASNYDDRNRWKNHLAPVLGELEPNQVDVPVLKRLIFDLREKGLSKGTVRLCIALLSSFFGDLVEDGIAKLNPVKLLSRKTRYNELTPEWDWKKTPFIHSPTDIRRVYQMIHALDPEVALAFIIGACAGLRTNEIRALKWAHIDFDARTIHVKEQIGRTNNVVKVLKDGESRIVPMSDSLAQILRMTRPDSWLVCGTRFGYPIDLHRMGKVFRSVIGALQLPAMRWYDATRHTFASQWVLAGGTLEKLREMMGHSSVTVTERYAHLLPGNYTDADRARVEIPVSVYVPALTN